MNTTLLETILRYLNTFQRLLFMAMLVFTAELGNSVTKGDPENEQCSGSCRDYGNLQKEHGKLLASILVITGVDQANKADKANSYEEYVDSLCKQVDLKSKELDSLEENKEELLKINHQWDETFNEQKGFLVRAIEENKKQNEALDQTIKEKNESEKKYDELKDKFSQLLSLQQENSDFKKSESTRQDPTESLKVKELSDQVLAMHLGLTSATDDFNKEKAEKVRLQKENRSLKKSIATLTSCNDGLLAEQLSHEGDASSGQRSQSHAAHPGSMHAHSGRINHGQVIIQRGSRKQPLPSYHGVGEPEVFWDAQNGCWCSEFFDNDTKQLWRRKVVLPQARRSHQGALPPIYQPSTSRFHGGPVEVDRPK